MKKNLLLRLCLMMTVMLSFYSCTNEDFYASAENEKQEIISKSLWKEDALFTQRIYDHFLKSYMSTEADQKNFFAEHGTPVWEYTMTMGFKRNQLFVPLIKNNQVIGVMRVQREDKKAFYSFTKDDEALQFFDIIMYNRNLYKLQPQKDEKLDGNITSKGGSTWTCTKRIVITGYHMEGDVMVMETSALDVCKYTYTGNKPPVDHLDVYTDGMEGGGGGDEEEGEEYAGSPCEKLKSQTTNATFKNNITNLEGKTGNDYESGFRMNLPTPNGSPNQMLQNKPGTRQVDITFFGNTYGAMHSHFDALYPIFSPDDLYLFSQWVNMVYQNNQVTNPPVPVPPLSDIFFTLVTSHGNYTLTFDSSVVPSQLPNYTPQQVDQLNKDYIENLNKAITVGNVSGNINYDMPKLEKEFLKFIEKHMNIPGLKLYRTEEAGNTELKVENGILKTTKCP